MKERLYIAYGSNLNLDQMALRCPTATIYSSGVLNNWKLVFRGNRYSSFATIVRKKGSVVPVVVWSIQPSDESSLDIYEGYPGHYYKENIMVNIEGGHKKKAMVYIMNQMAWPGVPSQKYIRTIKNGYMQNGLSKDILDKALRDNSRECCFYL